MIRTLLSVPSPGTSQYCRPCNTRRRFSDGGWCFVCGQLADARPGDPCHPCGGEGVVDGIIVGDRAVLVSCPACTGRGRLPLTVCRCGRQAPSGVCSECEMRGTAA